MIEEEGFLSPTIQRGDRDLYVVTVVAKFVYRNGPGDRALERIIAACIPNRVLQDAYNPTPEDSIWRIGRHAPTLGEDFRVRLHFASLQAKADWRVRTITGGDDA